MSAATGLVVTKEFDYRGSPEQWSNKYWFTGTPPASDAEWDAFATLVITGESFCYVPTCHVVSAIGYNDDQEDAHAVWTKLYNETGPGIPGKLTDPDGYEMSGDQAGMLEVRLNRKNSRGKWVYLRKYLHAGTLDPSSTDFVTSITHTAYSNWCHQLTSGQSLDNRIIRSQRQVEELAAELPSWYVTTRTLKRRGKRP